MTRLLWIDDEIDLLKPFVYGLAERGYQVVTATNGPDGIRKLRSSEFDLVLLDQIMSGMDGIEVLRTIKTTDPHVLVTMVTKSDNEEIVDEAYGELVDDFLIKPFTPAQLLAVLRRLLDKRRLVAERIGRQYMTAVNQPWDLASWGGWVQYYRALVHWETMLARYADQPLRDVQSARWIEADEEFARFVLAGYHSWLEGRGPLMSHRLIPELVLPMTKSGPVCMFLFDAMRADQWDAIATLLREHYDVETSYYCSILPSATPYARNAIFSGLLPLEIQRRQPHHWVFEETGQNRYERELFDDLMRRLNAKFRFGFFKAPSGEELARSRDAALNPNHRLNVVVLNLLDQLIHSLRSTRVLDELLPDESALVGATRVWFAASPILELFRLLSRRECLVVVTSDHGFVRVGRPVEIRGGREMSANLRYKHGGALRTDERRAVLLHNPAEFMLPVRHVNDSFAIAKSDYYFIYPTRPREYERTYKNTYQHGGVSLRELVVPVGVLTPKSRRS